MSSRKKEALKELTIEDVFCIACRCIYLQPVTMPCNHTLCLECFKSMVNITAYQCPTCRRRISNWLRKYKHNWNALVNENLWKAINQQFPEEIKKRLNDEDDGLEERIVSQGYNRISIEPGVIGREFEDMRKQIEEERQKIEIQNLELAKKIQEEEEANLRARNAENAELSQVDLRLATTMQNEIDEQTHQEQLLNEFDMQYAATVQSQLSLTLEKEKTIRALNKKKIDSREPDQNKSGPLDKMFSNLKTKKSDAFERIQNKENISSSSSSSSFYTDSYSSSSTTDLSMVIEEEDTCTCGRLLGKFDNNVPPCRFCFAQITQMEKLLAQQNEDYLVALDLQKKLEMSNFESYNLRKRSSSTLMPNRKSQKLLKGQQTLKFI
ncbi:E3 ubiquitin-protein ligase rnf168-like isoform X2 [Adelges cooleyi]|uniref:E3 ubiquitin-protein ligase rnf168-like isoform X2 n=1 Tax=Adelges cooleyi TaxID=133065 RepID=UPI0021807FCD|nr:E3 ubiquitin-protein ligase rnf168-like isoform X2 [Adelges cooleyi]